MRGVTQVGFDPTTNGRGVTPTVQNHVQTQLSDYCDKVSAQKVPGAGADESNPASNRGYLTAK